MSRTIALWCDQTVAVASIDSLSSSSGFTGQDLADVLAYLRTILAAG